MAHYKNSDNQYFKEGDKVRLDADLAHNSIVIIDSFTPMRVYATIYSEDTPESKWQVMTNRLTSFETK